MLFAVSCHIFLHQTTVRDIGHDMRPQKLACLIDCVCSGPSPRSRPPRRRMRCAEETNKNSRNSHKCARAFILVDAQACSACNDVRSMASNALCMWSGLLVCATNAARAFRGRVSDSGSLGVASDRPTIQLFPAHRTCAELRAESLSQAPFPGLEVQYPELSLSLEGFAAPFARLCPST